MAKSLVPIALVGGVNRFAAEKAIRDDQLVYCKNAVMAQPGFLSKRKASTKIVTITKLTSSYPYASYIPTNDVPATIIYALNSPLTAAGVAAIQAVGVDGAATGASISSARLAQRPQFLSFRDFVLIFGGPGSNAPMYVIQRDGTVPAGLTVAAGTFNGVGASALRPKLAAIYRNRLVIGNFGDAVPEGRALITMSDKYAPGASPTPTFWDGVISTEGHSFLAGGRDGDELVALKEVMLTGVGDPTQSALLALLNKSAYLITGQMQQTTEGGSSLGDLDVAKISIDCGCVSKETVVSTPFGVLWAGEDDVWLFAGGQLPLRVGTNIRNVLKRGPSHLRWQWSAAYYDGFYRLALHGEENQVVGDTGHAPMQEQWWLDLRDGIPSDPFKARWYGPMIYKCTAPSTGEVFYPGTSNLAVETRPGRTQRLYGVELLDADNVNNNFNLIAYDADGVLDAGIGGVSSTVAPENQVADAFIDVDIRTKAYDFGDPMIDKLAIGCELHIACRNDQAFQMETVRDGGAGVDDQEVIIPVSDLAAATFRLDVSLLDTGALTEEFRSALVAASPNPRVLGKTLQYRLRDQPGYVVLDGWNDRFQFTWNSVVYTAVLDGPTLYDTVEDFLDALVAAMNLVSGAVFTHNKSAAPPAAAQLVIISVAAGTWAPKFFAAPDTTEAFKTRQIGGVLGFDTNETPAEGASKSATVAAYWAPRYAFDIAGLVARVRPIPRRPL